MYTLGFNDALVRVMVEKSELVGKVFGFRQWRYERNVELCFTIDKDFLPWAKVQNMSNEIIIPILAYLSSGDTRYKYVGHTIEFEPPTSIQEVANLIINEYEYKNFIIKGYEQQTNS